MKKEYIDFYLTLTDRSKVAPYVWNKYPKNEIKAEFIQWFHKNGYCDVSSGNTHFMVTFYPTKAEKERVLNSVGYVPAPVKKTFTNSGYNHESKNRNGYSEELINHRLKNGIPGVRSSPEIGEKIMKNLNESKNASLNKHKEREDFLKRKNEFFSIKEIEDDLDI